MTTTIAADFTSIDIESTLITDYVAALPTPDHTLQLKVTSNCSDTDYTIDLTDSNLDTVNNKFVLEPDDVGQTAEFDNQILNLVLTKTVTSSGDKTKEYLCVFVDNDLKCDILTFIASNPNSLIGVYWQVLNNLNECTSCKCSDACRIFNYIEDLLNDEADDDCGCL